MGTNSGEYQRDVFAYIPEASIQIGYDVLPHVRASIGYSFMYWSNIVTAGDAVDRALNPNQFGGLPDIPATGRPTYTLRDTDFWLQSMIFTLTVDR